MLETVFLEMDLLHVGNSESISEYTCIFMADFTFITNQLRIVVYQPGHESDKDFFRIRPDCIWPYAV